MDFIHKLLKITISILAECILHRPTRKKFKKKYSALLNKSISTPNKKRALDAIQKSHAKKMHNGKIRVGFFVLYAPIFPAQLVFEAMLEDEVFSPFIVVIPHMAHNDQNMLDDMKKTYAALLEKYDNVFLSYDEERGQFKDFSSECDLVNLASPYDIQTHRYYTAPYLAERTCLIFYLSYSFPCLTDCFSPFDSPFYFYMWKVFTETPFIHERHKEALPTCDKETFILSGFSRMDALTKIPLRARERKCILIAPSLPLFPEGVKKTMWDSNFVQYATFFLELFAKYPSIDFVFRIHPMILGYLEKDDVWDKKKTEAYLNQVASYPNVVFQDNGPYIDIFANSDGIIHDGASFLMSYQFTGHPTCYMLLKDIPLNKIFLQNGIETLEHCYKAYNEENIIEFLENVILGEDDWKEKERMNYVQKELCIHHPHVSEYIVAHMKEELFLKK